MRHFDFGRFKFTRLLKSGFLSLLLVISHSALSKELGTIISVNQKPLPHFSLAGDVIEVFSGFDESDFIAQKILGAAPRGLIKLKYGERELWFRALHFDISDGPKIICPDMPVAEDPSTKKPVAQNLEDSCEKKK